MLSLVTIPASLAWRLDRHVSICVIALAAFVVAMSSHLGTNYYIGKWLGFGAIFLAFTGSEIRKRYGLLAAATIVYLLGSSLWVLYSQNRYASLKEDELQALRLFVTESALKLYMVIAPMLLLRADRSDVAKFGGVLSCLFLLISLGQIFLEAIFNGCAGENACGGALGNPSLNASMMAACLPLAFKYLYRWRWPIFALTVAGAMIGRSNAGLGILAAFVVVHLLSEKRWRLLAALPVLAIVGWYFLGTKFLSSGDRVLMWKFFMLGWIKNPTHWLFGTGFGSFGVFSKALQDELKVREGMWWIWMHNDWLQMLFETGFTGLALTAALFWKSLKALFQHGLKAEGQALILFGMAMCMNYLLHIALPCAFAAWLLYISNEREVDHGRRNRLDTGIN